MHTECPLMTTGVYSVVRAIEVYPTQLAKISFDKMLDHTGDIFFNFLNIARLDKTWPQRIHAHRTASYRSRPATLNGCAHKQASAFPDNIPLAATGIRYTL